MYPTKIEISIKRQRKINFFQNIFQCISKRNFDVTNTIIKEIENQSEKATVIVFTQYIISRTKPETVATVYK